MKHIDQEIAQQADAWLRELDIQLPADRLSRILLHLDWVLEYNSTMNLTAITDPREAVRLHVVDSLTGLPELAGAPAGQLADVGTGAGFPGLPLSIASGRHAVLVDSVGKKCRAIQGFLEESGESVNIETYVGRAEEPDSPILTRFAAVTMRAVAPLPSLVELAAPLLIESGHLIAWKGDLSDEELQLAQRTADIVGLALVSTRELSLPESHESRSIVSFRRVGEPRVRLPRRVGLAQKRPMS